MKNIILLQENCKSLSNAKFITEKFQTYCAKHLKQTFPRQEKTI